MIQRMEYKTTGIIRSSGEDQKQGWFYLVMDDSIASYYRWLYSRGFKKWDSCLNGCHLTFIAGEKESKVISLSEMNKFLGEEVEVYYDSTIFTNTRAFWLEARSDRLDEIRKELGMAEKYRGYHITLGTNKRK